MPSLRSTGSPDAAPRRAAPAGATARRRRFRIGSLLALLIGLAGPVMAQPEAAPPPAAGAQPVSPELSFTARMDRYMILERQASALVDTVLLIEVRALADAGEEMLAWGEVELALELIAEAVVTLEAAGLDAARVDPAPDSAPAECSPSAAGDLVIE